MSLSRNLWSVLLVAATSAVGTLVLVLNRDDAETAFFKRVNYDPLGALTQIAEESKVLKVSQFPDLERQRVIMAAANLAFRQDQKLTKKIIGEQMQGATQTFAIRQLIQSQIAAGDVIPAMETQLLVSGEKSIGTNGALWVASAAGSAELPEALRWLAKLKTRDEKLTAYDSLWQNLQKAKDDRGLHQLFLANTAITT